MIMYMQPHSTHLIGLEVVPLQVGTTQHMVVVSIKLNQQWFVFMITEVFGLMV